jgi:hypothetical protein
MKRTGGDPIFQPVGPMFLFVLWQDERFVFIHSDEKWAYYFPVRWLLVPHVLGGLIALLIGPFQFSSRFRQRHLGLHRIMGRVYLASVAVSAIVALYVSAIHQTEMHDKEWIFTRDIAWLITQGWLSPLFAMAISKRIESGSRATTHLRRSL